MLILRAFCIWVHIYLDKKAKITQIIGQRFLERVLSERFGKS